MLYPRSSETREVVDIGGIWRFAVDKENKGIAERWHETPLRNTVDIPVPSSYNDLFTDASIRDHIGCVWYERTVFIPSSWRDLRIDLRVGAAADSAIVYVNGKELMRHKGGFLPFASDMSPLVRWDGENRITICVDSRLTWQSLPPGQVIARNEAGVEFVQQDIHFDFFSYSGISRPVVLVATPRTRIEEMKVVTDVVGGKATVTYTLDMAGEASEVRIRLLDESGEIAAESGGAHGSLTVVQPHLWEPGAAYLYTLEAGLHDSQGALIDRYRLPVGIRTVKVTAEQFLINGKPFYFKGFGKHEDSDFRGRGLDHALNVRDFNLLKWIGANSFRTSHYPYSDEILDMADRNGIVVIDEAPAVGMIKWSNMGQVFCPERVNDQTLSCHLQVMEELITRDRNHPCVVMWSVSNEPATEEEASRPYFRAVIERTRALDATRPVTLVECASPHKTCAAEMVDVVCVNRYPAWYYLCGHPERAEEATRKQLQPWHDLFKKPIILSEFGADTIAGFHSLPSLQFSEEYQCEVFEGILRAIDGMPFVIGEHPWNFADFATKQAVNRVMGNRKGVFTRQRQPKAVAHLLRKRWNGAHDKWDSIDTPQGRNDDV